MAHRIEAIADTHIAVWFLWEPKKLSNRVLEYIKGIANSGVPLLTRDRRIIESGAEVIW